MAIFNAHVERGNLVGVQVNKHEFSMARMYTRVTLSIISAHTAHASCLPPRYSPDPTLLAASQENCTTKVAVIEHTTGEARNQSATGEYQEY